MTSAIQLPSPALISFTPLPPPLSAQILLAQDLSLDDLFLMNPVDLDTRLLRLCIPPEERKRFRQYLDCLGSYYGENAKWEPCMLGMWQNSGCRGCNRGGWCGRVIAAERGRAGWLVGFFASSSLCQCLESGMWLDNKRVIVPSLLNGNDSNH